MKARHSPSRPRRPGVRVSSGVQISHLFMQAIRQHIPVTIQILLGSLDGRTGRQLLRVGCISLYSTSISICKQPAGHDGLRSADSGPGKGVLRGSHASQFQPQGNLEMAQCLAFPARRRRDAARNVDGRTPEGVGCEAFCYVTQHTPTCRTVHYMRWGMPLST